jgi:site-specific recombinase XerD
MIEDMKVRNLSAGTIEVYVAQVAAFAAHFGKSPEDLGPDEVRAYQLHLVNERQLSASTLNTAVSALRFLYRVTLGKDWAVRMIPLPKQGRKLPVVLSPSEVVQLLEAISNLTHRAVLMTAYAAGLRTSEVVALRVTDIDSKRMLIRVEQGKGRKIVFTQMTKRSVLARGTRREDVPNLDLPVSDEDSVDQQLDKLPPFVEGCRFQAHTDLRTERFE